MWMKNVAFPAFLLLIAVFDSSCNVEYILPKNAYFKMWQKCPFQDVEKYPFQDTAFDTEDPPG